MVLGSKGSDDKRAKTEALRHVSVADGQIDSRELFQTERELRIRHGEETYRLRLTALNKLILTK